MLSYLLMPPPHFVLKQGDTWGDDLFVAVCDSDEFPDGFIVAAPIIPLLEPGCLSPSSSSDGSKADKASSNSGSCSTSDDDAASSSSSSSSSSDGVTEGAFTAAAPSAGFAACGLVHFEHTDQVRRCRVMVPSQRGLPIALKRSACY